MRYTANFIKEMEPQAKLRHEFGGQNDNLFFFFLFFSSKYELKIRLYLSQRDYVVFIDVSSYTLLRDEYIYCCQLCVGPDRIFFDMFSVYFELRNCGSAFTVCMTIVN